jgi:hypothetical protein
MWNYRIIRKRKSNKQIAILKKVKLMTAKQLWYSEPKPVEEYDYWLSEVYYDKRRVTPHSRSEPDRWYENPKSIIKDLDVMLKDAKKSIKEQKIYDVSDNKKAKRVRKPI